LGLVGGVCLFLRRKASSDWIGLDDDACCMIMTCIVKLK